MVIFRYVLRVEKPYVFRESQSVMLLEHIPKIPKAPAFAKKVLANSTVSLNLGPEVQKNKRIPLRFASHCDSSENQVPSDWWAMGSISMIYYVIFVNHVKWQQWWTLSIS